MQKVKLKQLTSVFLVNQYDRCLTVLVITRNVLVTTRPEVPVIKASFSLDSTLLTSLWSRGSSS